MPKNDFWYEVSQLGRQCIGGTIAFFVSGAIQLGFDTVVGFFFSFVVSNDEFSSQWMQQLGINYIIHKESCKKMDYLTI